MKTAAKIILLSSLILFAAGFVFAQRDLEVDYPEMGGFSPENTTTVLPEYVKYIFNFSLGISGVIVFLILIYAGVRYLTSTGDPAKQGDAKSRIWAALLGLAVLFGSYLILTTINPQLISLQVSEIDTLDLDDLIGQETIPPDVLFYDDIPIGGLIEELFLKERMDRIKEYSQTVKDASEEVADASQELNSLVDRCGCSQVNPVCGPNCSGAYCVGDPCPVRGEINEKREEIQGLINGSEDSEGLKYWQEELEKEINDFEKIFSDLISAEEMIKNCTKDSSENGRNRNLLGYNALAEYERYLENFQNIEGFNPKYPFEYISSKYNPFIQASFYCAETFISTNFSVEEIPEINPEELVPLPEITCEEEIKIGETVDNAEELAQMMLDELHNINNNSLKEMEAADNMVALSVPDSCVLGSCSPEFDCYIECVPVPCPEPEGGDGGGDEGGDGGGDEGGDGGGGGEDWGDWDWGGWDWIGFLRISSVLAQGCCEEVCISPSVCLGSSCPGDPAYRGRINSEFNIIQSSHSEVDSSNNKVQDFIDENIEDKLKISQIKELLNVSQYQLGACFNSAEKQVMIELGEGAVSWDELTACSFIKETDFYPDVGDCYGPNLGATDLMDNFFCCSSGISPVGY
jgi:hypothetical protein